MRKFTRNTPSFCSDIVVLRRYDPLEYIKNGLDSACEVILRDAAEEILPKITCQPTEELYYEYKGVKFGITVFQQHWDMILKVTATFDENQPD